MWPGFVGAAFWIIRAKFCANGVNAVYALHTERYLGSEWLVLVRDAFIAVQREAATERKRAAARARRREAARGTQMVEARAKAGDAARTGS